MIDSAGFSHIRHYLSVHADYRSNPLKTKGLTACHEQIVTVPLAQMKELIRLGVALIGQVLRGGASRFYTSLWGLGVSMLAQSVWLCLGLCR